MAFGYIPVDRDQQFLLPPDIREWLPEGHLAFFVLDVVEHLGTFELHRGHPNDGVGRPAYDPDMMLALLVYAYCTGVRSSRQVERLCTVDVAYRVICANHVPDHTTVARFRQAYDAVAQRLFVDALALCAAAGLARVGVVAVDGTRMGANASRRANRSRAEVEAEVAQMFAQAEATDAAEDRLFGAARGDEMPPELADRQRRRARLDAAMAELGTRHDYGATDAEADDSDRGGPGRLERAERALAALEAGLAGPDSQLSRAQQQLELAEAAAEQRGRAATLPSGKRNGRPPKSPGGQRVAKAKAKRDHKLAIAERRRRHVLARIEKARAVASRQARQVEEAKVNLTDPDSRLMKTQQGWAQAYNAQAAVGQGGVVLASTVTKEHNDSGLCQPMMAATAANLAAAGVADPVGTFLFDAGYLTIDNLVAPGPDRLIATKKSWQLRREAKAAGYPEREPPEAASPTEAMERRLLTKAGAELYGLRQHTVEPVFGQVKFNRGFARFMRRGLTAADAEWALITTAHNLLKLFSVFRLSPLGAT